MTTVSNQATIAYHQNSWQYSLSYRFLHWAMGGGFVILLLAGQQFNYELTQAYKLKGLMYHSTIGSLILLSAIVLVVKRFVLRHIRPHNGLRGLKRLAANGAQFSLYGLAILVPISGLMTAFYSDLPTMVFGFFDISQWVDDPGNYAIIRQIHEYLTIAAIGLVSLHILAALYHHFVKKDEVLNSMIVKLPTIIMAWMKRNG
jgi:cytochrome b561